MKKRSLTKEEILHLAQLSRLQLTDAEIQKYTSQFSETIEYIKNLDELDTSTVVPTNSVVDLKNITYEDGSANEKALTNEQTLSNAKKSKKGMFIVDRIMQE